MALIGCVADDPRPTGHAPIDPTSDVTLPTGTSLTTPTSALSPDELLTRVSLDLRGIRPTLEELEAFDGSPGQFDEVVERYLHDPHLGQRAVDLYSELVPSRIGGDFYVDLEAAYGDRFSVPVLASRVAEEPLRMFAYVVENDRPYADMVQGNWTVVDEVLAQVFPVDYPPGATGWVRASYTDGRPGAGVLSTNGLWWWKGAMLDNRQRARGNLVSRLFLCDDYLDRELPFSSAETFTSEEVVDDAVQNDPACQSCHRTLDPLSAHFWGFFYGAAVDNPRVIERYHPEQEGMWEGGPPPGFMDRPSEGLETLGSLMIEDPRFTSCFVQETFRLMVRQDADDLGVDLEPVEQTFRDTDGNVREVMRAIVALPAYQGYDPRLARRMIPPQILATMVRDLTGYTWSRDTVDLLDAGSGYAVVAGSSDGDQLGPRMATVSSAFVEKRLAQAAARFVVEQDRATTADRRLFSPTFDLSASPAEPEAAAPAREEIRRLVHRVLGRDLPAEDPEIAALADLWAAAGDATGDPTEAWITVVTALLRHPDLVMD